MPFTTLAPVTHTAAGMDVVPRSQYPVNAPFWQPPAWYQTFIGWVMLFPAASASMDLLVKVSVVTVPTTTSAPALLLLIFRRCAVESAHSRSELAAPEGAVTS